MLSFYLIVNVHGFRYDVKILNNYSTTGHS